MKCPVNKSDVALEEVIEKDESRKERYGVL